MEREGESYLIVAPAMLQSFLHLELRALIAHTHTPNAQTKYTHTTTADLTFVAAAAQQPPGRAESLSEEEEEEAAAGAQSRKSNS